MDDKSKAQKELILKHINESEDEQLIGLIYQILVRLISN